jgi:regulatory protein spx
MAQKILSRLEVKSFKKLNVDVDDLTINQLLVLISEHPSLLRRPIIMDDKRMQIGFNEDEIRAFLPRSYRQAELRDVMGSGA